MCDPIPHPEHDEQSILAWQLRAFREHLERDGLDIAADPEAPLSEQLSRLQDAVTASLHDLHTHQSELLVQNEELRSTQEELIDTRDRYRDLYDFAPVGYLTVDTDGRLRQVNFTLSRLLGDIERSHLLQQALSRFIAIESQDQFHFFWLRLQQSRRVETVELRLLKTDGTMFWAHLVATVASEPTVGEAQGSREYHLTVTDITESRKAEAMTRLASFPQLNPHPIVEVDLAGKVQYCNPTAVQLFPDMERQGMLHPWLANDWETMVSDFLSGGTLLVNRDVCLGDCCYQQTIHYLPHIGRIRIYGLDVTEQRTADEKLRSMAAELTRSNEELEQFAYVASHDLQEPLRAVVGYVSLIEGRLGAQLDEKSRQHMDGAMQGALRMQQLITDLLALSRMGSQGKPFVATSLETILEQALQRLLTSVQETGALITHDPLPTLCVDAGQLVQLFQNLIGNAIKFRGRPVPEIHIGAQLQDDGWLFSVRDNGIGIEPQGRERIFQIFQRLHTRTEYPGTGIGLALCKKIVERHGGTIRVESQPGAGSTFYFNLPLIRPAAAPVRRE